MVSISKTQRSISQVMMTMNVTMIRTNTRQLIIAQINFDRVISAKKENEFYKTAHKKLLEGMNSL